MRIACVVAVMIGCQQGSAPPRAHSDQIAAAPVAVRPTPPFDVAAPADPVIAIGRGDHFACAVHRSGSVDCWGQPKDCHACYEPAPPDPRVRRLEGISDAIAISANGRCFVRRTGLVACIDRNTGLVAPVAGVDRVRAATDFGCVLFEDGSLRCDDNSHFGPINDMHDAIAIAEGRSVTCVIRKAGTLACQDHNGPFVRVAGIDHVRAVVIADRIYEDPATICVLAATARCFHLDDDKPRDEMLDLRALASATGIAISNREDALQIEGLVRGQVMLVDANGTRAVPQLGDATLLADGCAVRATGAVACWGGNEGGVLGQPTTVGRIDVPATPVPGVANVASVISGHTQTWALTRDGRILHWGLGAAGLDLAPREIRFGSSFDREPIAELARTGRALCARGRLGNVWCDVDLHQLTEHVKLPTSGVIRMEEGLDRLELHHADGSVELVDDPFDVPRPAKLTTVETKMAWFETGACLQARDGHVTCGDRPMPQLAGATALLSSGHVGCAIVAGRVLCWKEGKTEVRGIESITAATDLKLGYDFACAVDGGRVACWHLDDDKPPVQVIASGAESVGLGEGYRALYQEIRVNSWDVRLSGEYGCAVMLDHTVQCWGANFFGELLDNSLLSSDSPVGIRL